MYVMLRASVNFLLERKTPMSFGLFCVVELELHALIVGRKRFWFLSFLFSLENSSKFWGFQSWNFDYRLKLTFLKKTFFWNGFSFIWMKYGAEKMVVFYGFRAEKVDALRISRQQ